MASLTSSKNSVLVNIYTISENVSIKKICFKPFKDTRQVLYMDGSENKKRIILHTNFIEHIQIIDDQIGFKCRKSNLEWFPSQNLVSGYIMLCILIPLHRSFCKH